MEQSVQLVIYRKSYVFDRLLILSNLIKKCENIYNTDKNEKIIIIKFNKRGCDAYLASAIVDTMARSKIFHKSMFQLLLKHCKTDKKSKGNRLILLKLLTPKRQFIDYNWNHKINDMVIERQNTEYAMSWLSTLGGAFSCLGDTFEQYAEIAGKISLTQFKLALKLGDPSLVARCKLYAAISLIQRNYLNYPEVIIREVFQFALNINDIRLKNMCLGIWERLRYQRRLRRQKHRKKKNISFHKY